ncbi:MAG TPA: endonuclease MutS2 [Thermomicrobiales bacterium]|nr:endonuclease MutS2 [Thermomicrobiales bacterium]
MDARVLATLEFDKVRELLEHHCTYSVALERARALEPSDHPPTVRLALGLTDEARALLTAVPEFAVRGARDIRALVRQARVGLLLNPSQLLEVQDTLGAARNVRRAFGRLPEAAERYPGLADLLVAVSEFPALEADIGRSIGPRAEVLDSASPELGKIRHGIRSAHDRLLERLNTLLTSAKYGPAVREPLVTMREGRYVIPVRADARVAGGIVHDSSASGQTVFLEPAEAVELNNRWRQLQLDEQHEVERVLRRLSEDVAREADALERTIDGLAGLDFQLAKGRFSLDLDASSPRVWDPRAAAPDAAGADGHPTLRVVLRRARHPLLTGAVVPIDIALGEDYRVLVITGPNTGGKTVALKTVGLLTLMAQAGLHIPANDDSVVSVFARVFADIGDEQSIEQSLSTFSSHLTNIITMLARVTPDSLVLLDELGAGTDPTEGAALARALVATLLERGALTVATTHYSELKSYAYTTPGVENASVEFDVETLSPTYRLLIGVPGRSNALAIAQRLGLPPDIVAQARGYLSPDEVQVDTLLGQIQAEREEAESHRTGAERERAEAGRLRREAERHLAEAERARASAREEGLAELETELTDLRGELKRLQKDREQVAVTREWLRQAEQRAGELSRQVRQNRAARPAPAAPQPAGGAIRPGDRALIASLGQQGEVLAVDPATGEADLQVGTFRLRRPLADLTRLSRAQARAAEPRRRQASVTIAAPRTDVPIEVDVRGMRAVEVDEALERYINDAYLASLPFIRIIHGKGTGALRQAVRDFLLQHPLVSGFEGAKDRQGGEGVTVAQIRQT